MREGGLCSWAVGGGQGERTPDSSSGGRVVQATGVESGKVGKLVPRPPTAHSGPVSRASYTAFISRDFDMTEATRARQSGADGTIKIIFNSTNEIV